MSEVLSQSEIDALVASLTMNAPMTGKVEHKEALTSGPKPYDFRDSRKLPERYLKRMFDLHEQFCRRFEDILANLRVGPVKLNVDSVEERLPTSSSGRKDSGVVSQLVSLNPLPYRAAVRFDHQVVLSILDAMLGGRAEGPYDTRKLTVLEQKLFDRVIAALADTLAASWRSAATKESELLSSGMISYKSDQKPFFHREASVVTVLLRAVVGRTSGFVELTFPSPGVATAMAEGQLAVVSASLGRDHRAGDVTDTAPAADEPGMVMHHLADTAVELSAFIERTNLSMGEVLRLRKGDMIHFGDTSNSVTMCVNGTPVFVGSPAHVENHYGVQLSGAFKQGGAT